MKKLSWALLALTFACESPKTQADLIVQAKAIYTADADTTIAEAMAIKDGNILAIGSKAEIEAQFQAGEVIDFSEQYLYPGINDAHAHFLGYARGLAMVNLFGTQSWQEVLERVTDFAAAKPRDFILGRGWDQNDWENQAFPTRKALDSLFPNTPVLLTRVDGHAAIANGAALEQAGVDLNTSVAGGMLLQAEGELSGVLIDNAVDLIPLPTLDAEEEKALILEAQANCFAVGITSLTDAGLKKDEILTMQALYEAGQLKLRQNIMVSDHDESLDYFLKNGPIESPHLRVKSVKFYLDGALGSRGALLLDDYSDDPGNKGLLLKPVNYFEQMADSLARMGWQMCVHAIGDSANRLAIEVFKSGLKGKKDHRWRIEHAQIVHPNDQKEMVAAGIIPSIQPTHASSDMYWAEERLGSERISYAYPAQSFLKLGATLPLGTDFPVEDINPMYTLRAAMLRQDAKGWPEGGFRPEEALSFYETLRGMTYGGAYASFEEGKKGALQKGHYADFIVVKEDLSQLDASSLSKVEIQATYLGGEAVFER